MNKPKGYDKTLTLRLTKEQYEKLNQLLIDYINTTGSVISMTEYIKIKLAITQD